MYANQMIDILEYNIMIILKKLSRVNFHIMNIKKYHFKALHV